MNKSITGQPCLAALVLYTNSHLSQDQGALSREKPLGCTFSLAKTVLDVWERHRQERLWIPSGNWGRSAGALLSAGSEESVGIWVSGKNSLGKGKGGSRGQSRHLAVPVSPSPCGPVPNAIFAIPTCRGAQKQKQRGSRHGLEPFYCKCPLRHLGSPSLEFFLHTWLLLHQMFLLGALEESREESLDLGTHRPGLNGSVKQKGSSGQQLKNGIIPQQINPMGASGRNYLCPSTS